ncbi:MAG: Ig-like domain-containing protein, partial [Treponemataceae bacterium]|nr:Ig-like domain-containing protein [Treponemataceae bacterium]
MLIFAGGQGEEKKEKAAGLGNWSSSFDISTKKPGTYNIYAEARDSAGNTKVAGPINIYVDPASDLPNVSIANPLAKMHVTGDLNIVGTCTDDDGVHEVYVKIDEGEWLTAKGKEFWSMYMPAGTIPDGRRKITVKGMDIHGLVGPEKTVVFDMDRQKPAITITAPAEGALLSGKIEIRGIATDANEVVTVEYSIDNGKNYMPTKGSWDRKKGEFSFVAPLDTRTIPSGPTVVLVRATDGCGSRGIKPVIFVVDNKPPVIELVYPPQGEAVDRHIRFMGKVQDDVAVASLSWSIGKESGDIPLRAGDPYWNFAYTLPDSLQKELELVLTARDTIGNIASKKYRIPIDRERDLPKINVIQTRPALLSGSSDAKKGKGIDSRVVRTEGTLFVSGRVQDDDGVKELRY